jgi:hypothetical protein
VTFTALTPGNHVHVITLAGTHYDATVSTNDGILTSLLLDDEPTVATILLDSVRDVAVTPAPAAAATSRPEGWWW